MKPLEGIKILDFTHFFSGPFCTLVLSDFGAEVIKLENPPLGDGTRYTPIIKSGTSTNYTTRNRGKKSVIMDLSDARQKAIFMKMVETADVVAENFKPGTMEKFGLSYENLSKINPKLVYTSISGYGQTGPWSGRPAFDMAIQAASGFMSVTGEEGGDPLKAGTSVADATGSLFGCIGTLVALYGAKATGVGQHVDLSLMDAMMVTLDNAISMYCLSGVIPKPQGNLHNITVPHRPFKFKDGTQVIVAVVTDVQWVEFCRLLGQPAWAEDPKYVTSPMRLKNREEVEKMLADILSGWDSEEFCKAMEAKKLVYSRINNVKQVVEHPQTVARNMVIKATYPDGTSFRVPGQPIKMSGVEDKTEFTASPLAYDTIEVLSQYAPAEEVHAIYDPILAEIRAATAKKYAQSK